MPEAIAASLVDRPAQGKCGVRAGNAITAAGRVFADGAGTSSQFRSTAEQRHVFLEEVYSNYAELQKQMDELHDRKRKMDYDVFHSNNKEIHDLLFGDAEVREGRLGDWDTWDRVEGIVKQFAYGRSHCTPADFKEIAALRERVEQLHHVVLTQRRQIGTLNEGMQPMQEELSGLVKLLEMKNREIRSLTSKNNTQTLQLRHMERECASLKSVGARHRVDEDQLYLDFKLLIEANKALERENAELRARLHANLIIPQRRSDARAEDAQFLQFDMHDDVTDLQSMQSVFKDDDKRMEYVEAQIPISAAIMHMKRAKLAWVGRTESEVASALCHLDYDANTVLSPQAMAFTDDPLHPGSIAHTGGTLFAADPFTSYFGYRDAATVGLSTRPVATVIAPAQPHRRHRVRQGDAHAGQDSVPSPGARDATGDGGVTARRPPHRVPPPGQCPAVGAVGASQSPAFAPATMTKVADTVGRLRDAPERHAGREGEAGMSASPISKQSTSLETTTTTTTTTWRVLRDCFDSVVTHSRAACLRREALHLDTLRQNLAHMRWQLRELCIAVQATPAIFSRLSAEEQNRVSHLLTHHETELGVPLHAMRHCAAACVAALQQAGPVTDMDCGASEKVGTLPPSVSNNVHTAGVVQSSHMPSPASLQSGTARHVAMMYIPVDALASDEVGDALVQPTANTRRRGEGLPVPTLWQGQSADSEANLVNMSNADSHTSPTPPPRTADMPLSMSAETCAQPGVMTGSLPCVGSPDRTGQDGTVCSRENSLRANALQSTQIFSAVWDVERPAMANTITVARGVYTAQSQMHRDETVIAAPGRRRCAGYDKGDGWSEALRVLRRELGELRSSNAQMHREMTDLFMVLHELIAFSGSLMEGARQSNTEAEATRIMSFYDQVSRELVRSAVQRRVLSTLEADHGIRFTDPPDVHGGTCDDVQWVVHKLRSAALELATEMVCNDLARENVTGGGGGETAVGDGGRRATRMAANVVATAEPEPPTTPQPRPRPRVPHDDVVLQDDRVAHQSSVAFRQDARQFLRGSGAWWPTGAQAPCAAAAPRTQSSPQSAGAMMRSSPLSSAPLSAHAPFTDGAPCAPQTTHKEAALRLAERGAPEWLSDPLLVRNFILLGQPLRTEGMGSGADGPNLAGNISANNDYGGVPPPHFRHLPLSVHYAAASQASLPTEPHDILQLLRNLRPRCTGDVDEMQPTVLRYDIRAVASAARARASQRIDAAMQSLLGANFGDFVKGYILPIAAMAKKVANDQRLEPAMQLAVRQLRAEEERRRRRNVRLLFMRVLTTFRSRRLLRTAPYHGEAFPAFVCLLYSRWRRQVERQRAAVAHETREGTARLLTLFNLTSAPPHRRGRAINESRQLPPVRASGRYQSLLLRPQDASSFHFDHVALPQ